MSQNKCVSLIIFNKAIVDNRLHPWYITHNEYFPFLSLNKIWLEFRLSCLSCSITT